jgi:hypothetical protein
MLRRILLSLSAGLAVACGPAIPAELTDDGGAFGAQGAALCTSPAAGCPCSHPGDVAECGEIKTQSGEYITCSIGHTTCAGSKWGACMGDHIVVKSMPGPSMGLHIESASGSCASPCDPECTKTTEGASDVDASGVAVSDGGVSITPTLGGGGNSDGGGSSRACTGLECQVEYCGDGGTTSLSGVVYDPAGKNPLYNAYVFIPVDPNQPLPSFTSGASCDACGGASNIVALASAQTGPDGKFTLNNVPVGANIPIVVQMGKWRRKTTLPSITACTNNVAPAESTRLPRNQLDGDGNHADIPKIAFVSGSADPLECLLLKVGLDPNEIGSLTLNSSRRIHYYNSPSSAGASIGSSYGNVVSASSLWGTAATLNSYDVVMLACEGAAYDKGTTAYTNLINYANLGGRVFTTHYGYVWMEYPSAWNPTATWLHTSGTINTEDPMSTNIVQSFPKGQAFAQWLLNVNASTVLGQLPVHEGRQDLTTVGSCTQSWMTAVDTNNNNSSFSPHMTFNTPYGAAASSQCGRVVYSDFHVSASATVSGSSCTVDTDCGFTATCSPPTPGTCTQESCATSANCQDSTYACNGGSVGTCSAESCQTSADCTDSSYACSGAQKGTCQVASCYVASDCTAGGPCSGGSLGACGPKACTKNSQCASGSCNTGTGKCKCTANSQCKSGVCNTTTGVCTNPPACNPNSGSSACGSVETCNGGTQGNCGCNSNSDCPGNGNQKKCNSPTPGSCQKACTTNGDCWGTELCVAGRCQGCATLNDCPGATTVCSGATLGSCQKGCSNNADCFSGEQCIGGQCKGCWTSNDCPGATTVCQGAQPNGTCSASSSTFPLVCKQGDLTPQEKALEFMLFDLTACVSPDNLPPPGPPAPVIQYNPVTFTRDFTATCPTAQRPVWRELDWKANVPSTSSIDFAVQTGANSSSLMPATPLALAHTTTSTNVPNWDVALIDTGPGPIGNGVFNTANPWIRSSDVLRVTFTLNPTSDKKASPTLVQWQIKYDCVDAE